METPSSSKTVVAEKMGVRIVAFLLIVAALSVFVLWTVNPIGGGDETTFALFVAVDVIAVAMISYVQRSIERDDRIGRTPMLAGSVFIVFLIGLAFYLLV